MWVSLLDVPPENGHHMTSPRGPHHLRDLQLQSRVRSSRVLRLLTQHRHALAAIRDTPSNRFSRCIIVTSTLLPGSILNGSPARRSLLPYMVRHDHAWVRDTETHVENPGVPGTRAVFIVVPVLVGVANADGC